MFAAPRTTKGLKGSKLLGRSSSFFLIHEISLRPKNFYTIIKILAVTSGAFKFCVSAYFNRVQA